MLFLPYQKRWIEDASRLKILEKSRQIGMSWATAYAVVRRQCAPGVRLDAWVASRDEIQARLFLDDCRKFARILDQAARALGARVLPDGERAGAEALLLANGTRVHSLSSNADAQAGKRGPRVLDEFALHPDPQQLYAIAYPGITWGGQLEILSTHRGAQNYFNALVTETRHGGNPKNFSLHRVTLQDALEQGFLGKLQEKLPESDPRRQMDAAAYFDFIRAACPDQETFLQEYMCVPADETTAFLPWELIAAGEYAEGEYAPHDWRAETKPGREFFLGVDIGRGAVDAGRADAGKPAVCAAGGTLVGAAGAAGPAAGVPRQHGAGPATGGARAGAVWGEPGGGGELYRAGEGGFGVWVAADFRETRVAHPGGESHPRGFAGD